METIGFRVRSLQPGLTVTCFAALSVFCWAGSAFGQTAATGNITGTIKDPHGLIVQGASVQIRDIDTGIDRTLVSNDAGMYAASFLQPGHYEVSGSKTGFSEVIRKGLTLQVGQTMTVDVALPLETLQGTVTVTGQATLIDPEKTEQSEVVSQTLVNNLPIAGRRWDNFVLLTPAVTNDGGSGLVSYRGISGLYNNNSVDGANNNQAFFSEARGRTTVPYVYSLDSIQEFQVSASNYSAEFGQSAGGVVNAITKSGTNDTHGDLFYFLRYPTFNALDPVNKAAGILTQPVHQQQQFGGSIGGHLIKDKLFYFATYDGSRRVFPISYTTTAPLPLACPLQVTPAQCAAANSFIRSLLGAYPRTANQDVYLGKLDYQLNARNHFSASFDFDDFKAPNDYTTSFTSVNNSVSANGTAITHERIFVATWNSTISNSSVNELRFQWARDLEQISSNAPGPSVTISNVTGYGEPNALPRPAFPDEHRMQFTDIVSTNQGRHTLKIGTDVNFIHELLINLFQGGGIYSYAGSAQQAFGNWAADVYGINLGDGKTGKHYTLFTQVTDPITGVGRDDFNDNDLALFIEDSWKPRANLTLNFGARYDLQAVPQPPIPNYATPLLTQLTAKINTDTNNFAPRIGIAYQMNDKTVIRAGYGMFYAKTSNSTAYAIRVENGVYQQQFNCGPTASCGPIFPNVIFTPPGPGVRAPFVGALTPQVINTNPPLGVLTTHGLEKDFVNPLVHEGELTIERQLPGGFSISGSYLFSRGLHLPVFVDANVAPATASRSYDITSASGVTASTITEPFYTQRLNPGTGVILTGASVVNSWYNGFVVTLRRQFSHGLELLANYTLSKSIDDGQVPGSFGTFYGTDVTLDPKNQKYENALSDLDQRHRFVGSAVYVPPYEKIANRPVRLILGGFTFATIVTVATGQPVTGQISGFPTGGVDGGVTGGEVSNSGSATGGRIPQVGRNTFTGPSLHNVDFRIMRQFSLGERVKLQLLGEAFNIFNHTNINSVNTTAYNYTAAGSGACNGHVNGCLVPNPTFLAPTSSTDNLYGARQLQVSGKITF